MQNKNTVLQQNFKIFSSLEEDWNIKMREIINDLDHEEKEKNNSLSNGDLKKETFFSSLLKFNFSTFNLRTYLTNLF